MIAVPWCCTHSPQCLQHRPPHIPAATHRFSWGSWSSILRSVDLVWPSRSYRSRSILAPPDLPALRAAALALQTPSRTVRVQVCVHSCPRAPYRPATAAAAGPPRIAQASGWSGTGCTQLQEQCIQGLGGCNNEMSSAMQAQANPEHCAVMGTCKAATAWILPSTKGDHKYPQKVTAIIHKR